MLYRFIWVLGADSIKINSFMASDGSNFQSFCWQKSPLRFEIGDFGVPVAGVESPRLMQNRPCGDAYPLQSAKTAEIRTWQRIWVGPRVARPCFAAALIFAVWPFRPRPWGDPYPSDMGRPMGALPNPSGYGSATRSCLQQ